MMTVLLQRMMLLRVLKTKTASWRSYVAVDVVAVVIVSIVKENHACKILVEEFLVSVIV
jgi:hypothetical protein